MMQVPKNCPYCGHALSNSYIETLDNTILSQTCSSWLDHVIKIRSPANDKSFIKLVDFVDIRIDIMDNTTGQPYTWATWNFNDQTLVISKSNLAYHTTPKYKAYKDGLYIPFFMPNLSKYRKLVDKIKTYITFT